MREIASEVMSMSALRGVLKWGGLALGVALLAPPVVSQEGTCGHREMRAWVDAEEVCYHRFGPMTEQWSLRNQVNLDRLDSCLRSVRRDYHQARLACELRGETAYREDGIHRNWKRYEPAYKRSAEALRARP